MTKVTIREGQLMIQLEGLNKLWALKSSITIPLDKIESVHYVKELKTNDYLSWWTAKVGLSMPGYVAEGTFFEQGERFFINIHQGKEGIILKVVDEVYQEVIVELDDAKNISKEIEASLMNNNE